MGHDSTQQSLASPVLENHHWDKQIHSSSVKIQAHLDGNNFKPDDKMKISLMNQ